MSPRNPETNAEMRERSRAKLVEAADDLFSERGYDATSLSAITAEAGLSHGLARYYFDAKADVLAEVIGPRLDASLDVIDGAPGDPDVALATIIDVTLEAAESAPAPQALVLASMLQPGPHDVFAEFEQQHESRLRAAEDRLRSIFAARGASDPVAEEILFRSTLEGIVFKICVYPETFPVAAARRRLHERYGLPDPEPWPGETPDAQTPTPRLRATPRHQP
ncbi:AcrR family transcriptional regulator [Pseudoclavibacter chungangensis]|nr:TetR/AcrR family transcriptional regulator [Pseudoclavibacter chungangensis]NYJ65506.1 AcrR family transcriptional regulator [Pseudoclavibacter chungangensis]